MAVNVQGLSTHKFPVILRWLVEKGADAAILTETHLPTDPGDILKVTAGGGTIWPGMQIFYVPGTGSTEGVTIVLGPRLQLSGPSQFSLPATTSGRILRLDLRIQDTPTSIIGVYGPAQARDRAAFFSNVLPAFLPSDARPVIMGGDFNCVLSESDCWYPAGHPGLAGPSTRLIGGSELQEVMSAHSLSDIWRLSHPASISFTHLSASAGSGARLDRFLISDSCHASFSGLSCDILTRGGFSSDHAPVLLSFRGPAPSVPRGTGLRSFPLELLNHPTAVDELRAFITSAAALLGGRPSPNDWANFKAKVLEQSHILLRRHRRLRRAVVAQAEKVAAAAKTRLETNADPALHGALLAAFRAAADISARAWEGLLSPAALAAQTLDHQFGDQSSFYFFRAAKPPPPLCVISTLNRPGRAPGEDAAPADLRTQAGLDLALEYAENFYSSDSPIGLFRPRPIDDAAQAAVLGNIRSRLPPCLEDLAEGPDGNSLLTREELEVALAWAGRGSAPGGDGLPYEFYRHFHEALAPLLLRVFNTAFQQHLGDPDAPTPSLDDLADASPLRGLLNGVICLVPKPGQPAHELSGYRPITLLNCDVKLVMLIISNRLQRPMDYVIDIAQSAFLRGRDISDNVRYHLGLRARLRELGVPAWLLHSDLAKAYDSANRGLLLRSMAAMGLRNAGVVHWNRILLNGSRARVRVNGFFTRLFDVHGNSFPQGGALSTNQWDFIGEVILSQLNSLQRSGRLSSFPLPSGVPAPAAAAFADDITAPILQPSELSTVVRPAFEQLAAVGTPAQSVSKTVLQHLSGPVSPEVDPSSLSRHQASDYCLLSPAAERNLRHLGVPFAASLSDRVSSAFNGQPASMAAAGRRWQPLSPNLLGRVLVASQCIASKAVYQANFHTPSAVTLAQMQRAVNAFVSSTDRFEEATPLPFKLFPSASVCLLPRHAGGLGITDLTAHFQAMSL